MFLIGLSFVLYVHPTSTTHNDMNDKFTEAIRLMKSDLAYFEEKYQGMFDIMSAEEENK